MRKLMSERKEIKVVRDQFGVPTTCDFIVKKTLKLIEKNVNRDLDNKIIHCVPSGSVCWYEFAVKIMENLLSNKQLIQCKSIIPVLSMEFSQKASRPKNSSLENTLLKSILKRSVEDWSESHSKLYASN